MFQGQPQGPVLVVQGGQAPDGLPGQGILVPGGVHGQAGGDIRLGEGGPGPAGTGLVQAVDVVALGVEFFPGQVRQAVHGIEIVKPVPGLLKAEAAGVVVLQPVFVVEGQGDQPQGLALRPGVLGQGVQGGGGVPFPGGPEIGMAQGAGEPDQQPFPQGGVLKAVGVFPAEENGKAVIAQGQPLGL